MPTNCVKRLIWSLVLAAGLLALTGISLGRWEWLVQAQEPVPGGDKLGSIKAAAADQWTPLNGPWAAGGKATALAVSSNVSGTVYAVIDSFYGGGHLRLYATTNGGVSWTEKHVIPPGRAVLGGSEEVYGLVVTGSRVIYGTTGCLEVSVCEWVTPDGGASIYRSNDGGANFSPVYVSPLGLRHEVKDVVQNSITPTILFAVGTEQSPPHNTLLSIVRSADDGLTWSQVYTEPTSGGSLGVAVVSPHTPTLVLVGGSNAGGGAGPIYRSADGGQTWARVYETPDSTITDLGFDPTNPNQVYAATFNRNFYGSIDGGQTWTQLVANGSAGTKFIVTDAIPPTIVAAWGGQILTSTSGVTWAPAGNAFAGVDILKRAPDNVLWAGLSDQAGVVRSDDGGVTWWDNRQASGIRSLVALDDIEPDPYDPKNFYVMSGGWSAVGAPFKGSDGGNSWSQLFPTVGASGGGIATHPFTPNLVLAGIMATIQRSADGGNNWSKVYDVRSIYPSWSGQGDVLDLGFHPTNPQIAYAVGEDNPVTMPLPMEAFILRSTDGGLSWTRLFTRTTGCMGQKVCGFTSLSFDPNNTAIAFVSGGQQTTGPMEGVIYRTVDGGNSWQAVLTHANEFIRTVAVAPWNPNYVYAATIGPNANMPGSDTTLYRSTDGGVTWTVILNNAQGNLVKPDVSVPNRLYLSSPYWAGVSFDAGDTFYNLAEAGELPVAQFGGSLTLRPGPLTQTLYIGNLGLWEKSIPNFEILTLTPASKSTTKDGVLGLEVGFSLALTYTPRMSTTQSTGDQLYAGLAFILESDAQAGGQLGTTPATITLSYAKAPLPVGVNETALQLYRWDDTAGQWQTLTVLARDTTAKTITFLLNHLSEFSLQSKDQASIYLPVVLKP